MKTKHIYDLNVLVAESSLSLPKTAAADRLNAVRVRKLALVDRSGTALRVVLAARDGDQSSDVASFFSRGLIGRESPIRNYLVTLAEIEFEYYAKPGAKAPRELLTLTTQGPASVDQISPRLGKKLEAYLSAWNIFPKATLETERHCLSLLGELIEEPRRTRMRYMFSWADRGLVDALIAQELLKSAPCRMVKKHVCPQCFEQTFLLEKRTCAHCGSIDIGEAEYSIVTPNYDMVFSAIRRALAISIDSSSVVEDCIWLLGTHQDAGIRRKVLFARQLQKPSVQKKLFAAWETTIGDEEAVFITTSHTEQLASIYPKSHVHPRFFAFKDCFKMAGEKWQASSPLLELVKKSREGFVARHGCFSDDFSQVLLPNETKPIDLSKKRRVVFKFLWENRDREITSAEIVAVTKGARVEDVFPKKKAPEPYRAFGALVVRRRGHFRFNCEVDHLSAKKKC